MAKMTVHEELMEHQRIFESTTIREGKSGVPWSNPTATKAILQAIYMVGAVLVKGLVRIIFLLETRLPQ